MGIDIVGFSKARRIVGRHSDQRCDEEEHLVVGCCRKLLDGRTPGCYVSDGKLKGLYASYAAFDTWQNDLSLIVHGIPHCEVSGHLRRFKGQPFVELIGLPFSNDVGIGPTTAAKLYGDFVRYAVRVRTGFQRRAAAAAREPAKRKRRPASAKSYTGNLAASIARALGGMAIGGDDDPHSTEWQWKWELYRDFREAFRLARYDGMVILSI